MLLDTARDMQDAPIARTAATAGVVKLEAKTEAPAVATTAEATKPVGGGFGTAGQDSCMDGVRDQLPPSPPCDDDDGMLMDAGETDAAALIFSDDAFPSLPDFPCLSSPSCSSSSFPPAPGASTTTSSHSPSGAVNTSKLLSSSSSSSSRSSSSSSTSWSVVKEQQQQMRERIYGDEEAAAAAAMYQNHPQQHAMTRAVTPSEDDVGAEDEDLLAGMDLLDDDLWDTSALFPDDDLPTDPSPEAAAAAAGTVSMQQPLHEGMMNHQPHYYDHQPAAALCSPPQAQMASHQYHNNQQRFQLFGLEQEGLDVGGSGGYSDELAVVFLEWLKSNKEAISPEDLRSIRLRKSTIESAVRRLGGGKEGIKQLLKLILAWVQNYHLHKRRLQQVARTEQQHHHQNGFFGTAGGAGSPPANCSPYQHQHHGFHPHEPPPNFSPNPNNAIYSTMQFPDASWMHTVAPDPAAMGGVGGCGGLYVNTADNTGLHDGGMYSPTGAAAPSPTAEGNFHMVDPISVWPPQFPPPTPPQHQPNYPMFPAAAAPQFPPPNPHYFGGFGQYGAQFYRGAGQGDVQFARLASSATKEARKKRMARQRRFLSLHHQRSQQNLHHQQQHQPPAPPLVAPQQQPLGAPATALSHDWAMWASTTPQVSSSAQMSVPGPELNPPRPSPSPGTNQAAVPKLQLSKAAPNHMRRENLGSEKFQGMLKPEKNLNLRFLLQKALKQSDVGSLGRIVLPKKEAEIHLPELEARDGISITMEDIGTSRSWNMRYRFWPNNKSRMYLLENTGEFVRCNGLQEGDYIVIYSDVKRNKYLIRGVKVSKPAVDPKGEATKSSAAGGKQHMFQPTNDAPYFSDTDKGDLDRGLLGDAAVPAESFD